MTSGRGQADRELLDAIQSLERALDNVRRARRNGSLDLDFIRRALDDAERQLRAAREGMRRALDDTGVPPREGAEDGPA